MNAAEMKLKKNLRNLKAAQIEKLKETIKDLQAELAIHKEESRKRSFKQHQIINGFLNGKITHPLKRNGVVQHITIGISDGGPVTDTRVVLLIAEDDIRQRLTYLVKYSFCEGYEAAKHGGDNHWLESDSFAAMGEILTDFVERQK